MSARNGGITYLYAGSDIFVVFMQQDHFPIWTDQAQIGPINLQDHSAVVVINIRRGYFNLPGRFLYVALLRRNAWNWAGSSPIGSNRVQILGGRAVFFAVDIDVAGSYALEDLPVDIRRFNAQIR